MFRSCLHLRMLRQTVFKDMQIHLPLKPKTKLHSFSRRTFPSQICSFCSQRHHFSSISSQQPNRSLSSFTVPIKHRTVSDTTTNLEQTLNWQQPDAWKQEFSQPEPQLNWNFLCNADNRDIIRENTANRKGVGDIDKVCFLWERFQAEQNEAEKQRVWQELLQEGLSISNTSHPDSPIGAESSATTREIHSEKKEFDFRPRTVVELGERLQMLRTDNVAVTTGPRTYYFLGQLARLEHALVGFTLRKLKEKGFQLVSVPDLLHPDVIESCGFKTQGERTQVYQLKGNHNQACLAGTAEMALAGLFMNEILNIKELPQKMAAVSRCYRAETSDTAEERGIYRVHQFTKVEMFGVTADQGQEESERLLQEFLDIERELFVDLDLHFRVLDMPTEELGAPAHHKFDIETWMPAKGFWGEISSASNCTDFQSRRLNIRYKDEADSVKFAHTVNGTACAVPRMVMALLENNQQQDGSVFLPKALEPWMGTCTLSPPQSKNTFVRIHDRRKRL